MRVKKNGKKYGVNFVAFKRKMREEKSISIGSREEYRVLGQSRILN